MILSRPWSRSFEAMKPKNRNHIQLKTPSSKTRISLRVFLLLLLAATFMAAAALGALAYPEAALLILKPENIVLFFLIAVDIAAYIAPRHQSQAKSKNNTFLKLLLFLFVINYTWDVLQYSIHITDYPDFYIAINYALILLGLIIVPASRKAIIDVVAFFSDLPLTHVARKTTSSLARLKLWVDQHRNTLTIWLVTGITLFGAWIRFYSLDPIATYEDEYSALAAAEQFFHDGDFQYPRAYIVTYSVIALFAITGQHSLEVARWMPLLFGIATIPLMYFLGRRVSWPVGILSAFVWSILPLAIGLSRYVREYSVFGFITVLYLIYISYFIRRLPQFKWSIIGFLHLALLLIPVLYYELDPRTTFLSVFPVLLTFAFFLLIIQFHDKLRINNLRKMFRGRTILSIAGIVLFLIILIPVIRLALDQVSLETILSRNPTRYFQLFFGPHVHDKSSAAMWFYSLKTSSLAVIALLALPLIWIRKQSYLLAVAGTFAVNFLAFAFFLDSNFQARYAFYFFPLYVILFATAIYMLYRAMLAIESWPGKIILALLILALINPIPTIDLVSHEVVSKTKTNPIIGTRLSIPDEEIKTAHAISQHQSECIIFTTNSLYFIYNSLYNQHREQKTYLINSYNKDLDYSITRHAIATCDSGVIASVLNDKDLVLEPERLGAAHPLLEFDQSRTWHNLFTWGITPSP